MKVVARGAEASVESAGGWGILGPAIRGGVAETTHNQVRRYTTKREKVFFILVGLKIN
jgi:hypothetical protein